AAPLRTPVRSRPTALSTDVALANVGPGEARLVRGPNGPRLVDEPRPVGQGGPPRPGLLDPADEVALAVAVEVAHLHVRPVQDAGLVPGPLRPRGMDEARPGREVHPPVAALLDAPDDIRAAV